MGLSRNKIKLIRSFKGKKFRDEHQLFVAEGDKLVSELLKNSRCYFLAALPEWLDTHPDISADEIIIASEVELNRATFLKTPPPVIALFHQPNHDAKQLDINRGISLALDGVQDPGNVGTIVRIADWFGIEQIICSSDTADIYNPKTVQATMGAIARVKVIYTDMARFLREQEQLPIYGTFLDGHNIYEEVLPDTGIVVLGSEGKGISREVEKRVTRRLYIPSFPPGRATSESLNVATAAAIICSEFRRGQV
ncbi:MAG: RNA methyltransferase [Bacteroidota bacterium]|jgi:TrmH family RNA methyltransferase|nr:RNA methyltransferase [Bacteroidota bacterium]